MWYDKGCEVLGTKVWGIIISSSIVTKWTHKHHKSPTTSPYNYQVWVNVSMHFINGLPLSKGKTTLFVVVDAYFVPLSHPYTMLIIAHIFCCKHLLSYMGCTINSLQPQSQVHKCVLEGVIQAIRV